MYDLWLPLAILGAVGLFALYYFRARHELPLVFANEREESLTRQLAQTVGCSLGQALAFVRNELDHAPSQADDTLLKRAAYHYRQELPEKTCQVYRDRAPG
ncbi:MAG: hypothetical protein EXS09_18270 [Gemmataceae bacterium]|nr:hypothetical protein [Gemmataceae bacterium]